jgi:putative transcriptional regulator
MTKTWRRKEGVERVLAILSRAGFYVFDLHHARPSSFDLIARRDSTLLLVKVLKNIDALGPADARELSLQARLLEAAPLLVGSASGSEPLEVGVVYNRYGIPVVTLETLQDYVWRGVPPFLFSSPGGVFAKVDSRRLRELRESRGLSLGALAEAAGVSRRTIQLYEEGAGAEVEVVERLERFLGTVLAAPFDIFDPLGVVRGREVPAPSSAGTPAPGREDWTADVLAGLDEQGWDVVVTNRSPFDALARPEEPPREDLLFLGLGDLEAAQRRAHLLGQIARVAEGRAFFVVRERRSRLNIQGTPLVTYAEIRRRANPEELRELLEQREAP